MPITSGCSVIAYAFGSEPSAIMPAKAATVSVNGGKAGLMGMRPAISHRPQNSAMEASLHTAIPGIRKPDARSGSSATEAAPE